MSRYIPRVLERQLTPVQKPYQRPLDKRGEEGEGKHPPHPQDIPNSGTNRLQSLWARLFNRVEKNQRYEINDVVDTFDVKLVLWDASLQCAGDMAQGSAAGWDAVMICSDVMDPATMQEPLQWVSLNLSSLVLFHNPESPLPVQVLTPSPPPPS